MCQKCERQHFSCDEYAIDIIKKHNEATETCILQHDVFKFVNLDRRMLRRWVASVLWRAHVSSRPEFFDVDIGLQWASQIRKDMEVNGDFHYVDAIIEWLPDIVYAAAYGVYECNASPPKSQWAILVPHIKITAFIGTENLNQNRLRVLENNAFLDIPQKYLSLSHEFDNDDFVIVSKCYDQDLLQMFRQCIEAQKTNEISRKLLEKDMQRIAEAEHKRGIINERT